MRPGDWRKTSLVSARSGTPYNNRCPSPRHGTEPSRKRNNGPECRRLQPERRPALSAKTCSGTSGGKERKRSRLAPKGSPAPAFGATPARHRRVLVAGCPFVGLSQRGEFVRGPADHAPRLETCWHSNALARPGWRETGTGPIECHVFSLPTCEWRNLPRHRGAAVGRVSQAAKRSAMSPQQPTKRRSLARL